MNFANMFSNKSKGDVLDSKHKFKSHGKEMWNVLHTFSVYLPEKCHPDESKDFVSFVDGVLTFGTKVNPTWQNLTLEYIKQNPYTFSSRENAMLWICHFHNFVNIKTEKDLFECTKENISKRWGNASVILSEDSNSKKLSI